LTVSAKIQPSALQVAATTPDKSIPGYQEPTINARIKFVADKHDAGRFVQFRSRRDRIRAVA